MVTIEPAERAVVSRLRASRGCALWGKEGRFERRQTVSLIASSADHLARRLSLDLRT